jgi:seryl-tRNA synthetase
MKESDHLWKAQRLETDLQFKSDELDALKARVEALLTQISKLEGDKVGLENRVDGVQKARKAERERLEEELRNKEEEAETIRRERAELLDQYRDLMDTKTALDNELANYTALLETEEDR